MNLKMESFGRLVINKCPALCCYRLVLSLIIILCAIACCEGLSTESLSMPAVHRSTSIYKRKPNELGAITNTKPKVRPSQGNNYLQAKDMAIPQLTTIGTDAFTLALLFSVLGGSDWKNNANWVSVAPLSTWFGVTTNSSLPADHQVISLDLNSNNLQGTLPSEISCLVNLETLILSNNYISSTIPPQMGLLTNLQRLDLGINRFEGSIPSNISNLSNLNYLAFSSNHLSRQIPPTLSTLVNLVSFSLSWNWLTGTIPTFIGLFTALTGLTIQLNSFTGTIPSQIQHLTNLQDFQGFSNNLRGSIPTSIGFLTALQQFDFSSNGITSAIPSELGLCTSLTWLNLNSNSLNSSLPASIGNLTALQNLWLYNNSLSKQIPPNIGNLANLEQLYLYSNRFSGSLPATIGGLTSLQRFGIYSNKLSSSIPCELGNCLQLTQLDLGFNHLIGPVPEQLGVLPLLSIFSLNSNSLTSTLPQLDLNQLVIFNISSNKISGSLPASLFALDSIRQIDVSNNMFQGRIFDDLLPSADLTFLNISNLYHSCFVSRFVRSAKSIDFSRTQRCQDLQDLAMCSLAKHLNIDEQGTAYADSLVEIDTYGSSHPYWVDPQDSTIPIAPLQSLTTGFVTSYEIVFDADTNICAVTDSLQFCADPACTQLIYESRTYDAVRLLSSNAIYLRFHNGYWEKPECQNVAFGYEVQVIKTPHFIGWRCAPAGLTTGLSLDASVIQVHNVSVDESLATAMCDGNYNWIFTSCNEGDVTSLNLGELALSGTLPSQMGLLSAVVNINLAYNAISGQVPSTLGNLKRLSSLDLQYNDLSGTLPSSLGQLSSLKTLRINYNNIGGTLPRELGNLSSLTTLDLSFNNFYSTLPESYNSLSNLAFMYLYSNRLTGSIPLAFNSLSKSLQVLSLAANFFDGKISSDICEIRNVSIDSTHNPDLTCYESCWIGSRGVARSDLTACAPSWQPTVRPTANPTFSDAPTLSPTNFASTGIPIATVIGAIAGIVVFCGLLFVVGYYASKAYSKHRAQQQIYLMLNALPVHQAILARASEADILAAIRNNPLTLYGFDDKNRSALDLALEFELSDDIIYEILAVSLPLDPKSKKLRDPQLHGYFWAHIVQSKEKYAKVVERLLSENADIAFELAHCKTMDGIREVIDIAFPVYKKIILMYLNFCRRFKFKNMNLYKSSHGGLVCSAKDFGQSVNKDEYKSVALKFMKSIGNFSRDKKLRQLIVKKSNYYTYFIEITESFDILNDSLFRSEVLRWKALSEYKSMVVMPLGERSLREVISSAGIAGKEWHEIKRIAIEVAEAVSYLHSCGVVHCDLKPNKIVLIENRFKLIDFDSSAEVGTGFSGAKVSSAFTPPELLYLDPASKMIVPRTFQSDESGKPITDGLAYDLVPASTSHDTWSYGITMFSIFSKYSFFQSDGDDNCEADDLKKLFEFDDDFKRMRFERIDNLLARNLISQLLMKDASRRINMNQVLDHPFLSGKAPPRMIGQDALFDVFISYRVASDSGHAKLVYNLLTAAGLRVWLDVMCLKDGVSWEAGFCDGLISSRVFLPLLSKGALANFKDLQKDQTWVDNVLLEYHLSLELRQRGLIDFIVPVLIGNIESIPGGDDLYSDYFKSGCAPDLWSSGAISVNSVSEKVMWHLDRGSLGSLLLPGLTVKEIFGKITENQGHFIRGAKNAAFAELVRKLTAIVTAADNNNK